MDIQCVASLSSRRGGKIPVAVSLESEHLLVACPSASSACTVSLHDYCPSSKQLQQVVPLAHSSEDGQPPQALQFSSPDARRPLLLCSASPRCTLLWQLEEREGLVACAAGAPRRCQADSSVCGPVSHIAFSADGLHVAVSMLSATLVYHTRSCLLDTTLLGHTGVVSCALFLCLQPLTLLTLSHDRSFKVGVA